MMKYNPRIHPERKAIAAMLNNFPKNEPVVMLNILRFREKIMKGTESGAEAYSRYSKNIAPHIKKAQAKILYKGKAIQTLVGNHEDSPHEILLVQYPTVQHFIDMISTAEYLELSNDRTIALEFGGLVACDTEYINNE
ncbi:MAG: DUF1330 domain-containing protein [Saprospiraceae bacterium]